MDALNKKVVELKDEGFSYSEIAAELNITKSKAYREYQKNGNGVSEVQKNVSDRKQNGVSELQKNETKHLENMNVDFKDADSVEAYMEVREMEMEHETNMKQEEREHELLKLNCEERIKVANQTAEDWQEKYNELAEENDELKENLDEDEIEPDDEDDDEPEINNSIANEINADIVSLLYEVKQKRETNYTKDDLINFKQKAEAIIENIETENEIIREVNFLEQLISFFEETYENTGFLSSYGYRSMPAELQEQLDDYLNEHTKY